MHGKVLITGASRGLGLCLAARYLEMGGTVFACAREPASKPLAELKEKYGGSLIPIKMDVASTEAVNKAAAAVARYTDKLDLIINNAGIHSDTSFNAIESTNLDDCVTVYDVNAVGPLRVVKSFLPLIAKSGRGLIVNISSESGSISTAVRTREFDYCMSKAALNMGTKLLHNYLKGKGVNVVAVHPGWMRTDMGGPNADLDPYENAVQLVELFNKIKGDTDGSVFIDNQGREHPW